MIRIFSAKEQYRSDVIALWQEAFGDNEEYINFFLDSCPGYDAVGYFDDERLVSMFFMLEGQVADYKCKYLYAACTAVSHRRQGIMEKLIDFAREHYRNLGYDGIFLVPANEKLYSYYSKFGFVASFKKSSLSIGNLTDNDLSFHTSLSVQDLALIKLRLLEKIDCFSFDVKTIEYTINEHLFNGGKVGYIKDDSAETLVFCYYDDDKVFIKEYLNSDMEIDVKYYEQFLNINAHNVYILCPLVYNKKDIVEEYTKCGMCLPLNDVLSDYLKINSTLYAGMYLD